MSELLRNIDARTRLAGTNKLEILLFTLGTDPRTGRRETFGINVFKVREVMRTPPITAAPEMPSSVEGMVSLRGVLVPVVVLVLLGAMPYMFRNIQPGELGRWFPRSGRIVQIIFSLLAMLVITLTLLSIYKIP